MFSHDLVEQLLALPDVAAQRCFLHERVSLLDDQVADALKEQADRFLRSDIRRSLQTAELLLYQATLTNNSFHRALGLLAEANAWAIGLGEYQRAIELYDEATQVYRANGNLPKQARAQIGKIIALARLGRYAEALEIGRWAGQVLEAHAQWRPLADLTLNLAMILGRLGEDGDSLVQLDRARELYRRLGVEGERFLPWVEHDRAIALRNLGQFEAALKAIR